MVGRTRFTAIILPPLAVKLQLQSERCHLRTPLFDPAFAGELTRASAGRILCKRRFKAAKPNRVIPRTIIKSCNLRQTSKLSLNPIRVGARCALAAGHASDDNDLHLFLDLPVLVLNASDNGASRLALDLAAPTPDAADVAHVDELRIERI